MNDWRDAHFAWSFKSKSLRKDEKLCCGSAAPTPAAESCFLIA